MDELGSGVRNTFKYSSIYTPGIQPDFIEDDIFRTIIPLKSSSHTAQITTQIATQIVELLRQDLTMSRKKLSLVLKDITEDRVKYHLDKLKEEGEIKRIGGTRENGKYWSKLKLT